MDREEWAKFRDVMYAPVFEALRALVPLTYVRAANPYHFVSGISDYIRNVGARQFQIFGTTDPEGPTLGGSSTHDPIAIFERLMRLSMKESSGEGLGILEVEEHQLPMVKAPLGRVVSLGDLCDHLVTRRVRDPRWISMCFFVGHEPATRIVPESLRDIFYPIELVGPSKAGALDTHVRKNPATVEQINANHKGWLQSHNGAYNMQEFPALSEDRVRLLEGMTEAEVQAATSISTVRWVTAHALGTEQPDDIPYDPEVLNAYRHRWARVA